MSVSLVSNKYPIVQIDAILNKKIESDYHYTVTFIFNQQEFLTARRVVRKSNLLKQAIITNLN